MYIRRTLFLVPIFILLFCAVGHAGPSDSAAIRITETALAYELTVPVSRLIMTIPNADLTYGEQDQAEAAGSARYFIFRHKKLNLSVSGWFEPEENFPGLKKFWAEKTGEWSRAGLPPPEVVSFGKLGGWQTVSFVVPDPALPLINASISAHWLQAGTWIELDLSITSDQTDKESGAKLVKLLKAIQVREKTGGK